MLPITSKTTPPPLFPRPDNARATILGLADDPWQASAARLSPDRSGAGNERKPKPFWENQVHSRTCPIPNGNPGATVLRSNAACSSWRTPITGDIGLTDVALAGFFDHDTLPVQRLRQSAGAMCPRRVPRSPPQYRRPCRWMPKPVPNRLLAKAKPLYAWHPPGLRRSGNVHSSGASVRRSRRSRRHGRRRLRRHVVEGNSTANAGTASRPCGPSASRRQQLVQPIGRASCKNGGCPHSK